jgi:hypothetical protein
MAVRQAHRLLRMSGEPGGLFGFSAIDLFLKKEGASRN